MTLRIWNDMPKAQRTLYWTIFASEFGHVFCCALPVLLSIVGIFSAYGALNMVPGFVWVAHDFMHQWEFLIIAISAALLGIGWMSWFSLNARYKVDSRIIEAGSIHHASQNNDNKHGNCQYDHCVQKSPKKMRIVLCFATVLFAINFSLYMLVHKDGAMFAPAAQALSTHGAHAHHEHNHDGHEHRQVHIHSH